MNCREVEEREILERYVLDQLKEPEREVFEQHYFECDSCFAQVQIELAIQAEVRRPFVGKKTRGAFLGLIKIWVPAFAALASLFALGVWRYTQQKSKSQEASSATVSSPAVRPQASAKKPSLDELARVEAPPYSDVELRNTEDEAQTTFRRAMKHYLKNDYASAIPELRAAVMASPRTARFNFYLGSCYLLTGQNKKAVQSLRKVVSLGDPAYSEAAHFYLAKAYLQSKDVSDAEDELKATVKVGASKAAEAGDILRQLGK